jgi:hypothetical protein
MKKPKIDLNKIIRVKPRMIKEGPDVAPLFTINSLVLKLKIQLKNLMF